MFPYGSGFGITGQKGYYSTIGGGKMSEFIADKTHKLK